MVLLGSEELKPCLQMTEVARLLVKLQHTLVIFNLKVIILNHKPYTNFSVDSTFLQASPTCPSKGVGTPPSPSPFLHPSN